MHTRTMKKSAAGKRRVASCKLQVMRPKLSFGPGIICGR